MNSKTKKPVILLTGFLGSGKTTFLNRLLASEAFHNSLVVINEFGSIGIDHHLVQESSETLLELSNGCACCSVRGELVETLANQPLEQFDRVIIETTGIANPLPIFQSLAFHYGLSQTLKPATIITTFDTKSGFELVESHQEALHQISMADTIVMTKTDLTASTTDAESKIRSLNQTAHLINSTDPIMPDKLEATTAASKVIKTPLDHHAAAYSSTVLATDQPLSQSSLSGLLHTLSNQFGAKLLRIKGFAKLEGRNAPVAVQVSGDIVHDFEPLEHWPGETESTQLVVITKGASATEIQTLFSGFMGDVTLDAPDQQALLNNPLAIPGL